MRIHRLLVLLPGTSFGAAEAHALRLCRAATGCGMIVTTAAHGAVLAHLRDEAAGACATLLDCPVRAPGAALGQDQATRDALAAALPEAVLLALPTPGHAAGVIPALAEEGVPTLVILHAAPRGSVHGPDDATMAAVLAMRAEWVAVSRDVATRSARWLGLPEGLVSTIPDSLDRPQPMDRAACRAALRAELGVGPDVPVALFLGRLDAAAGADHLPALADAFGARTGGVLAFAGEGILQAALREASGAEQSPRFLAAGHDPDALRAGADVLVMPSRTEGAPLGFLAAASHRLPVVASAPALEALGGHAAAVAALADPDDPEAFAEAMTASLDGQGPAAVRTEAAWGFTEAWRPEAMVERCLGRLRRLAAPVVVRPSIQPAPAGNRLWEAPAP